MIENSMIAIVEKTFEVKFEAFITLNVVDLLPKRSGIAMTTRFFLKNLKNLRKKRRKIHSKFFYHGIFHDKKKIYRHTLS
jgi:hypothetical protein